MSRNNTVPWQPACSLDGLKARARMLAAIRAFFAERGVQEVETPLLCQGIGTDPHLDYFALPHAGGTAYLQTSPEFAMKRLLAAGSGPIYQICKAFRRDEQGRLHNPEFSILEWYRPGFDLDRLMDEMEDLLTALTLDYPAPPLSGTPQIPLASSEIAGMAVAQPSRSHRATYRDVFQKHTGLDPLESSFEQLCRFAERHAMPEAARLCGEDRTIWLDLLFSFVVQPNLGQNGLCFVYDYPACLPSLAKTKSGDPRWVERVELFWQGMELANGFHELADAEEQARRFQADLTVRRTHGQPLPEPDARFLAALQHGLPDCAGVALGLDRLLMLLEGVDDIAHVLAFPFERA